MTKLKEVLSMIVSAVFMIVLFLLYLSYPADAGTLGQGIADDMQIQRPLVCTMTSNNQVVCR
jgi:hypothetical protein